MRKGKPFSWVSPHITFSWRLAEFTTGAGLFTVHPKRSRKVHESRHMVLLCEGRFIDDGGY
jgi:hypothetical protein